MPEENITIQLPMCLDRTEILLYTGYFHISKLADGLALFLIYPDTVLC